MVDSPELGLYELVRYSSYGNEAYCCYFCDSRFAKNAPFWDAWIGEDGHAKHKIAIICIRCAKQKGIEW